MPYDLLSETCRGWLSIALRNERRDEYLISLLEDVREFNVGMVAVAEKLLTRFANRVAGEERKALYETFSTGREHHEDVAKQADEAIAKLRKFPPYLD